MLVFTLREVFAITERQKVELRGEACNAPNLPSFGNPGTNIDSGPGISAAITTVQGLNRTVQIGLKYSF